MYSSVVEMKFFVSSGVLIVAVPWLRSVCRPRTSACELWTHKALRCLSLFEGRVRKKVV